MGRAPGISHDRRRRNVTVDWGEDHIGIFPAEMLATRSDLAVKRAKLAPLQRMSYTDLDSPKGMSRWLKAMLANPPDFQFLHALANDATGGDSMLADGVAIAKKLRTSDPKAFEILATRPVPFRFHGATHDIRHSRVGGTCRAAMWTATWS
jgi:hypothetical protein